MAKNWDTTQPVFDGFKIPDWAMQDPYQEFVDNLAKQEQQQAQMRMQQLAEQRQTMEMDELVRRKQVQDNVADYVRTNPAATPEQVYGAVQNSALSGGDVSTWLKIAEQMSEETRMKERAKREQERAERTDNNSAINTMARLAQLSPDAAFKYAQAMGLDSNFGFTREGVTKQKQGRGETKTTKRKMSWLWDNAQGQNAFVDENDPITQALMMSGRYSKPLTETDLLLQQSRGKQTVKVELPRYTPQQTIGRVPNGGKGVAIAVERK